MTYQLNIREPVKFARPALFEYLRGKEGSLKVCTAVASRKLKEENMWSFRNVYLYVCYLF
jgi:hypothetical protein